jgi:hypothetical protein
MFKLAFVLGVLVATFALFNADAQTQRPPIADALLHEPISLMDWGIMHADRDIKSAVERLNKAIDDEVAGDPRWRTLGARGFLEQQDRAIKEYKTIHPDDPDLKSFPWNKYFYNPLQLRQFTYKYSFGYAEWSVDQQRIRVGVAVVPSQREHPDAEVMRPILWDDLVTTDRCTDLLHDVKAALLWLHPIPDADPAYLMIETWFGHNGQRVYSTSWLDQIIAITNIEVELSRMGESPEIECSQPLNGGSVTIHDHRQNK